MIYWRCYLEDFEKDTQHLSMLEDGAYNRLLRYNYRTEKPLPADMDRIYELARAVKPEAQAAVRVVLAAYYTLKPDGYHNKRVDEEIRVCNTARENGKLGGNPWVKELYNEPGFLYAIRGKDEGTVKVGITVDPKRRLSEHRRNLCGETLLLVPVSQMGVAESAVLERFAEQASGEWLTLDSRQERQLLDFMGTFNAPDSVPARVPKRGGGSVADSAGDSDAMSEAGSVQPSSLLTKTSLSTTQPLNHLSTTLPRASRSEAVSSPSWQAYSTAYETRYGVAPVRNAKVNTALKRFVEAVGAEEAPAIAAFYVTSSEKFYVLKKHPADLLAKDAEKLRTEWATGRSGTETEARQIDRTAATGNVFAKLIDEAEAGPRDGALVEPPNGEDTARWWLDDEALMFQGDEKGVVRVPGQPFEDYIARVLVAMGDGPWMDEQPAAMHNRITFWRAKGFNPPELMPLPAQASAPTRARAS